MKNFDRVPKYTATNAISVLSREVCVSKYTENVRSALASSFRTYDSDSIYLAANEFLKVTLHQANEDMFEYDKDIGYQQNMYPLTFVCSDVYFLVL